MDINKESSNQKPESTNLNKESNSTSKSSNYIINKSLFTTRINLIVLLTGIISIIGITYNGLNNIQIAIEKQTINIENSLNKQNQILNQSIEKIDETLNKTLVTELNSLRQSVENETIIVDRE